MLAEGGERLPTTYRRLLADPDTIGLISSIGLWEIAIKYRIGKLKLNYTPEELLGMFPTWRIGTLWLSPDEAVADVSLDRKLKDPFDRMFIAVAQHHGLPFLTTDAKLLDHPLAWRP